MVDPERPVPGIRIDELPVAAASIDLSGAITHANDALTTLVGHGVVPGVELASLCAPGRCVAARTFLDAPAGAHTTVLAGTEGPVPVELRCRPSLEPSERIVLVTRPPGVREPVLDDVVSLAYDVVGRGLIIGDGANILYVSETAARLFGRTGDEIIASGSVFPFFTPSEQARLTAAPDDADGAVETVIDRPDGSQLPVEIWKRAVVDGPVVRTVTVIGDNSSRRQRQVELTHLAMHDPLTGLPNRRLLLDQLSRAIEQVRADNSTALLLFIDLDGFKSVNDNHGHQVGDEVLRIAAHRIRSGLRECDLAARLGGDEFAVVCAALAEHGDDERIADRIRASIAEPVVVGDVVVRLEASIGRTLFDRTATSAIAVLADADADMYAMRRQRRSPDS